jgi:hypothetical protein
MKALAIIVFVVAMERAAELALYTIFAPLPLSTFASDVTSDTGKSFLKGYIGTIIQMAVIAVMFFVYLGINDYIASGEYATTKLIQFVALGSLALGVIKSGTWAKRICGSS